MLEEQRIHWLKARFTSRETEAQFAAYAFKRYLANNIVGVIGIIALNVVYIFADFIDTTNPWQVLVLKLSVVSTCLALLGLLHFERFKPYFEAVTLLIVIILATSINIVIWWQPDLDNTYYIGLIQGLIFFALILRLGVVSWLLFAGVTQGGFMLAAFSKADMGAAVLQSSNVFIVAFICVTGVNIIQRYQRVDFWKSRTIEAQNRQLARMLEDEKRDNQRKIAALATMVHFVRTPIHQISGFTDVILAKISELEKSGEATGCLESARYIKNASAELVSNVTRLLEYHRLDEMERGLVFEQLDAGRMAADAGEEIHAIAKVDIDVEPISISTAREPLAIALRQIVANYNAHGDDASRVRVEARVNGNAAVIVFRDDGEGLDPTRLDELSRPLTEMSDHLNTVGAQMPMGLRTARRALEMCGGHWAYVQGADENVLTITLPDRSGEDVPAATTASGFDDGGGDDGPVGGHGPDRTRGGDDAAETSAPDGSRDAAAPDAAAA